ncbi:MAG: hypothetical protein ACRD0K_02225 [Egibacteraceae bacterium]
MSSYEQGVVVGPGLAKRGAMSQVQEIPKRGGALTTILIFLILGQVLGLVLLFVTWRDLVDHGRSGQGLVLVAMALVLVALAGLGGIWQWRRWGVYLFGLVAVIGLISDPLLGISPAQLLVRIGLLAALAAALRRRWESFH